MNILFCQVALDIMSYHATANAEESEMLSKMQPMSPVMSAQLHNFSFTDTELEDIDTLTVSWENKHQNL